MRRKIPNTALLVAFEAAARHQSFTKAAKDLALTQSAVCRQIAALEDFVGVRLFQRTRRGVTLTDAGRAYSKQVSIRLDAVEHDTLALMAHQGQGATLELAVVPTFTAQWLLPRLPGFLREHPGIVINFTTRTRPFLFDDTEFDAAIHFGEAGWPGTESYFLMRENAMPVCSPRLLAQYGKPRRALSPEVIEAMPLMQQSTRPYAWRQWFESLGMRVAHDMSGPRYELFSMLAQAAMHDMGIALIPPMMIEEELQSGRLVVANPHWHAGDKAYYLIIPERKSETRGLREFRRWLEQQTGVYRQASGLE